jgi:excisionase family DNA binding protein
MHEGKIAYSVEEASEYTGIGRNTLRKLIEWEKLPVLKVGRKLLIRSDTIESFIRLNEGRDLRDKDAVREVSIYPDSTRP